MLGGNALPLGAVPTIVFDILRMGLHVAGKLKLRLTFLFNHATAARKRRMSSARASGLAGRVSSNRWRNSIANSARICLEATHSCADGGQRDRFTTTPMHDPGRDFPVRVAFAVQRKNLANLEGSKPRQHGSGWTRHMGDVL